MRCISTDNEIKLEQFFSDLYNSTDYSAPIKNVIVKIMVNVFTNDKARVIKNLGLNNAKELDVFFPGISEYAKEVCLRIAIFSEQKTEYHCPNCFNKVDNNGNVNSNQKDIETSDYTPYHQTEQGKIEFEKMYSNFTRTDDMGIVVGKLISVMNINPDFFNYYDLTYNEYFQLLKFLNITNTEDINDYKDKAIEFLNNDLIKGDPIKELVHKMVLKHLMTHYCNKHPYERLGFTARSDFRKLIKEMYPTWYKAIEDESENICLRKVLGKVISKNISCNHCVVTK